MAGLLAILALMPRVVSAQVASGALGSKGGIANATPGSTTPLGINPASPLVQPIHAGEVVTVENADLLRIDEDNHRAEATGNVRVGFRDYTLYADKAVIDTNTGAATFTGHVHIDSGKELTSVTTDSPDTQLLLNLHNGSYSIRGAERAVIDPNLFTGSELLLPLRVNTNSLTSDNGIIDARSAGFTTCDFPNPHYSFSVSHLTIVPGKHLVAHHAILYRRNRKLIEFNDLILPLNNRYSNQNYLPTVGEDPYEGYFAKFAYPYALTTAALGILRLDLIQKQGIGTGFDQSYQAHGPGGGGTFSIYHLQDNVDGLSEFTGSLTHHQSLGDFLLSINSSYESNSYLSSTGSSQSLSNAITLRHVTKTASTTLSTNIEQSKYGFGESSNLGTSIDQKEQWNPTSSGEIKIDYASFRSPAFAGNSSSQQSTLATNLALHFQPSGLKVDILTNLFNALQSGSNGFGVSSSYAGLERRPEIMLTTTGTGSDPLDVLSRFIRGSQIQTGFGSYDEQASSADTTKYYFGYDTGNQHSKIGAVKTTYQGGYQQSFYGDNGARYLLVGHYNEVYDDRNLQLSADYATIRAYGFTPFFFDQTGQTNSETFNLQYAPSKSYSITAGTAYDFLRDRSQNGLPAAPWQDLLAIADLHPSKYFGDRLQTTTDLNHQTLYDVSDTMFVKDNNGFGFQTSLDYVPMVHKLTTINGSFDLPIILDKREQSGYKLNALAGYNGYSNQFTYKGLAITRSWHDWELTATYEDNPSGLTAGNTFYFTFHLKALPGYQPFGVGAYGQGLASGIGQVY